MQATRPRGWAAGRLALIVPLCLAAGVLAQVDSALYWSGEGAVARLRGDTTVLPADAARCANCHEPSGQSSVQPSVQPADAAVAFGPRLDARLAQALPRRGGPATAYDAAALCTLLRTGLDPARVLVQRAMPVYEIDNAACAALWQALSQREALTQRPLPAPPNRPGD